MTPALLLALVALRADPVPLTPDEARRLTPDALADRLLAPGHPAAVEAVVGPEGMEPPTPPNSPEVTRIRLFLRPVPLAGTADFCERTIVTLFLKPAWRTANGTIPPATADTLSAATAYHWAGQGRPGGCDAPRDRFFQPGAGELAPSLAAVRQLVRARQRAAADGPLGFALTLDDAEGRELRAYQSERSEAPGPPTAILTDARRALASLPIEATRYAGPIDRMVPRALTEADATAPDGSRLATAGFFIAGEWTVGIAWDGAGIRRVRMVRAIPAPF